MGNQSAVKQQDRWAARPRSKTLVFHIGDPKTGTTSLQSAFARGQVEIAGAVPFYSARVDHNYLAARQFQIFARARNAAEKRAAGQRLEELAASIARTASGVSIISAEWFSGLDPEDFRDIVERFFADSADEIRVVAYVRPHAQRLLSSFAEQIKIGGFFDDLEAFHRLWKGVGRLNYFSRFSRWQDVLGERFVLRPFVRSALIENSVVADFVVSACGTHDYSVADVGTDNEALSLEDLMRIKFLQRRLPKRGDALRHTFGWEVHRLLGQLPQTATRTKIQMHRSLAETIREEYREDARRMDASFFDGIPLLEDALDVAVREAIAAPQSIRPKDHFNRSELRSLSLMADLMNVLLENGADWSAYFHGKRTEALHARSVTDGETEIG